MNGFDDKHLTVSALSRRRGYLAAGLLAAVFCPPIASALISPPRQDVVTKESLDSGAVSEKVTPILRKCAACHGGRTPAANLDLTMRASGLKGGKSGPAIVPGSATASRAFALASARKMPPDVPLTESEIEALRKWIDSGAAWPSASLRESVAGRAGLDWWSLQRPIKTAPPHVRNAQWVRNPVDAFVLAELEKRGLQPAPPADRRTLLRRITYDLLGVPPTADEVTAFVADNAPDAYERLVERLLADPRYGERWGRHWLDVVRFGESQGFERDIIRDNAWRYRDYVVRAFNGDKPYDQFIREQLAGDTLSPPTDEGIIATGFLVCGPWDEVGHTLGSDVMRRRVREEEMEDMVSAVSQTFLGLTANCARCHDHKFDPIPQRDYYRLKSALDGVQAGDRPCLTPDEQRVHDSAIASIRAKQNAASIEIARIEGEIRGRLLSAGRAPGSIAPTNSSGPLPNPVSRWTFEGGTEEGATAIELMGGAQIHRGRLHLSGSGAYAVAKVPLALREKTLEAWVVLSDPNQRGGGVVSVQTEDGARFDAIVFGEREPGKWTAGSEFFHRTKDLTAPAETAAQSAPVHVAITYAADGRISVYRNGKPYGDTYVPSGTDAGLQSYPAGGTQVLFGLRHSGAANGFLAGDIEEARIYDRALSPMEIAASYARGIDTIRPAEIERAATNDERARLGELRAELKRDQSAIDALGPVPLAYAALPKQPGPTAISLRGDSESRGEIVAAGGFACTRTPTAEFGLAPDCPEADRRRKLADWIADARNPLTARVLVNRIWHYHFGTGIVATPNDFGFNGDRPSHPKLLDWLARAFVDGGWRIKPIHRLILLSNTYRQSAAWTRDAARIDSEDRLLWRFPPHRLEGEAVRDAMLWVSGKINWKRGGPGFRPFIVEVNNSHFYKLTDGDEPELNRRTLYRTIVNSARNPLLDALDCPDPSTKTPRRSVTTTATQALEMMNEAFVLRQARAFADRLKREAGPDSRAQIRRAYLIAFGRGPTPEEITRARGLLQTARLETFTWALLNSSEFIYTR